jgi:hypothetical protein
LLEALKSETSRLIVLVEDELMYNPVWTLLNLPAVEINSDVRIKFRK